jgi:hypothetical protein
MALFLAWPRFWMLHGAAFGDPVRGRFLFFFSFQ